MIITDNPYRLDIKEDNYRHCLDRFDVSDYAPYAFSAAMTFDVIPRLHRGKMNGFFASVFSEHFFGMLSVYDEEAQCCFGLVFGADAILSRFCEALSSLKALCLEPGYCLLSTAATFNAYHNYRLTVTSHLIARVEKRTRYSSWDNIAHVTADEPLSDLSAQMSGIATSLAANRRLTKMADEILRSIDGQSTLADGGIPWCPDHMHAINQKFHSHICIIKRRVAVQQVHIELLLAQVQNQLTAVSIEGVCCGFRN